jgi:hypothetical protein
MANDAKANASTADQSGYRTEDVARYQRTRQSSAMHGAIRCVASLTPEQIHLGTLKH